MNNQELISKFKNFLIKEDLSDISIKGYLQDISSFKKWIMDLYQEEIFLLKVSSNDLRGYRETLSKINRQKVSSINRKIQSLKRLYKWALKKDLLEEDPCSHIHFLRHSTPSRPKALSKKEVHVLLMSTGYSSHGLSKRNYALVQVILQAGLRIGEVANLKICDLTIRDRSGIVKIVDSKGRKYREVFLKGIKTTLRRALKAYMDTRDGIKEEDHLFVSNSGKRCSIRSLQHVISDLSKRVKSCTRITPHVLRHTFATHYLESNPNGLVNLAAIMGHDSPNTTAIYTKPSEEKIASSMEMLELNLYGD